MESLFIFGWVSTQVAQNFAAWATAKDEGTLAQAEQFHLATVEDHPYEDWFCVATEA